VNACGAQLKESQRLEAGAATKIYACSWSDYARGGKQLGLLCHNARALLSKHPSIVFGEQQFIMSLDCVHADHQAFPLSLSVAAPVRQARVSLS
jgi:hypothetical protein